MLKNVKQPLGPIPQIAIDNYPEAVQGDSLLLNPARYALKSVREVWDKVREASHVVTDRKALADAAEKALAAAEKAHDSALHDLETNRVMLSKKIDGVIHPIQAPDQCAGAIRDFCAKQKHPFKFVSDAIRNDDRRTVVAIFAGPHYLANLTAEQYQTALDLARSTFCPEDVKVLSQVERAAGRVQLAGAALRDLLRPHIAEWRGTDTEKAALAGLSGQGS